MKQLTILIAFVASGSFAQEISVSRDTIWLDTVKRGPLVRAVRGLGTVQNNTTVELNIPESQVSEVRPGQAVNVDSPAVRGLTGRVSQVNPAVNNGTARIIVRLLQATNVASGTKVDGTVELEKLSDAVYVGRPVSGRPNSEGTLFKIESDGQHATKVRVKYGQPSLKTLQVLDGLQPGDKVILSDVSAYEQHSRITLK
jgi:multidrug efflux pump subunit AcrA (membrane-fusion protein)